MSTPLDPKPRAVDLVIATMLAFLRQDDASFDDVVLMIDEMCRLPLSASNLLGISLETAGGLLIGMDKHPDIDVSRALQGVLASRRAEQL